VTESRPPKAAARARTVAASKALAGARPLARATSKTTAKAAGAMALSPVAPATGAPHHPNLGLAPVAMTAAYPAAATLLGGKASALAAAALRSASAADPEFRSRHDDQGLALLQRDAELLVARLALCLGSGRDSWLVDYAEWIGPIERRRGVPLADFAAVCAGLIAALRPELRADEWAAASRSLEGAAAVFKRNGRVGGDRHPRNAFLKWFYRGV